MLGELETDWMGNKKKGKILATLLKVPVPCTVPVYWAGTYRHYRELCFFLVCHPTMRRLRVNHKN